MTLFGASTKPRASGLAGFLEAHPDMSLLLRGECIAELDQRGIPELYRAYDIAGRARPTGVGRVRMRQGRGCPAEPLSVFVVVGAQIATRLVTAATVFFAPEVVARRLPAAVVNNAREAVGHHPAAASAGRWTGAVSALIFCGSVHGSNR
jgi:hypothetical protein